MSRKWTGATLLGVAMAMVMALVLGGTAASAATDPSVPETESPETSMPRPTVETSEPAASETYTLTVGIDADQEFLITQNARVAVHEPGAADPFATALPCTTVPVCQEFELAPGDYELSLSIDDSDEAAFFFLLDDDRRSGFRFELSVVDTDVALLFGLGGTGGALPVPTTVAASTSTSTTVASGGPVPVAELPETGNSGRLGVASFVLVAIGAGCVVAARRRPV